MASKLKAWADAVEQDGLRAVRRVPGYHDESLRGRRQGQRSIRLSQQWRAIYILSPSGTAELVTVTEVTPHAY